MAVRPRREESMTTTPTSADRAPGRAPRLLAVIGALLLLTAGLLSVAPAAQASVLPAHGSYHGVDHGSRTVSFTFSGNQMMHFSLDSQVIGGAHVSNGAWHETCHNGMCTKGMWVTDKHVTGYWRASGGHWVSFSATLQQSNPYKGTYMGSDIHHASISFTYGHGYLTSVVIAGGHFPNVPVTHGHFSTCHSGVCFQGHWQDDYEVVGHWSTHHAGTVYSFSWTARAFSS